MAETLLVVNAGSSSIKFQLFEIAAGDRLELEFRGQMEGIGTRPHLVAKDAAGDQPDRRPASSQARSATCRPRSASSTTG